MGYDSIYSEYVFIYTRLCELILIHSEYVFISTRSNSEYVFIYTRLCGLVLIYSGCAFIYTRGTYSCILGVRIHIHSIV